MRAWLFAAATLLVALVLVLVPGTPPRVRVVRLERRPPARIEGRGGAPARFTLAEFSIAPGADAAAAKLIGEVLLQDLQFEGAFEVAPGPPSVDADGTLVGIVRQTTPSLDVELHAFRAVGVRGEEAFARGYSGPPTAARTLAHIMADEVLRAQSAVEGVALTRLAFVSDRGGLRRELGGMMRRFKEIWIADYDGANEQRITSDGDLDITPAWSPDGRAIAYTSYRRGFQDLFVVRLDDRRLEEPTRGTGKNWLPAWSPDGTQIVFTSVRDGNEEIYVMNRDGTGARRLTRHGAIDTSPAWSPDGTQIAFTSNRTGSPQIWVMGADGSSPRALTTEKQCDRPTWSPAPYNEIAYVARTKTGYDIKVVDPATGVTRQLTFGGGFNESPSFAPNGRHIAFTSTRRGGEQIWVIDRLGGNPRQLTTIGHNSMPAWSK
jgi:TolB protein